MSTDRPGVPGTDRRRPHLSSHAWLHAHLVLVGTHAGVFVAYNVVLAVLREPSPVRYVFWGTALIAHAAAVQGLARRQRHAP